MENNNRNGKIGKYFSLESIKKYIFISFAIMQKFKQHFFNKRVPVKYFFYAQHEFSPLFLNTIEEMKEYFLILLALSIFFDWFGYINMKSVDIKLCVFFEFMNEFF